MGQGIGRYVADTWHFGGGIFGVCSPWKGFEGASQGKIVVNTW